MFSFPNRTKLAVKPVDMRKSFNGLWSEASEQLKEDPFSGALFVFTNKRRDRIGLTGTVVACGSARSAGKKVALLGPMVATHVSSLGQSLGMLLDGIDLKQGCKKAWYER